MHSVRAFFPRVLALLGLLALPASADHPRDFRTALDGLRANKLGVVDKVFLKNASRAGSDRLLALYELGEFYHLAGDTKKSIGFFNTADAVAKDYEGQAVVSAGATGRTAGAILANESVMKYEGFGYDKVMSRTTNAINFLLLGDLEGARVELRKAEEYQRLERERHQREVSRAGARQPAGAENARVDNPAVQASYGRMFDHVKNVRNSFENAFTYYLSSQIHQVRGEAGLNDAMVEIRRAFELAPRAPGVRAAYLEIARAQSDSAFEEARTRLGMPDAQPVSNPAGTGSVVVVFETGLVPQMDEVKINLFADNKLYGLAFPIYNDFGAPQAPLTILAPDRTHMTSTILETRTLAVKALQERMPGILTRGLLGAIAKGEVQQQAEKNFGPLGGLLSKVTSAALTSADRRSWLSLPAEVQVAKFNLAAGPNRLELRAPGLADSVALDVAPGSHSFLLVRAFPGFKRIDVRTFQPGDEDFPAPRALPAPIQAAAPAANLQ
ncbi:MAG: hypothetical protein P4L36_07975 [Holophaga sp.]|nr:hypothetical protein [Holophaga sp.]